MTVEVQLDSAGKLINAVDLHLVFSPQYVQVLRIDQAQSVWPLWPERPTWDNHVGTISLVAGRPHGLIAINASVATIVFRALGTTLTQVVADGPHSGVYLNDGQGTKLTVTGEKLDIPLADPLVPSIALLDTSTPRPDHWTNTTSVHVTWAIQPGTEYSYSFSDNVHDQPSDSPSQTIGTVDYANLDSGVYFFSIKSRQGTGDWSRISQYRFLLDQDQPSAFDIVPLTATQTGRQPAISWTATDQTSGIVESRLSLHGRDVGPVQSPLPIRVSWASKVLTITVVDGAGNTRSVDWRVPGRASQWPLWSMFGAAALVAAGIIFLIGRRSQKRRS